MVSAGTRFAELSRRGISVRDDGAASDGVQDLEVMLQRLHREYQPLDEGQVATSVMFTCGMYDYSGQWVYRVGVPAKSGVGGGVMAVINRQAGIATFSPRLDSYGNSRRGIEVCTELASRLGLHVFDCLNVGSSFLSAVLGS
jgi:hypothetical protein